MEKKYFKINQIAKFFGINTSALRYYEQYGLLKPAYIDKTNKYRYYDLNSIDKLETILSLRQNNMDMAQIIKYLNGNFSREVFVSELKAQRDKLNELIKINEMYCFDGKSYDVSVIDIPECYIYGKKYLAKNLQDIYNLYSSFLIEALPLIEGVKNSLAFVEFDTLQPKYNNLKIFIGLQLNNSKNSNKYYNPCRAIRTFHKGTYETLGDAYNYLSKYMKENKIIPIGNSIEYYHESFNQRISSNDFLTEIIIPIK